MEREKFWSRVGHWFKSSARTGGFSQTEPDNGGFDGSPGPLKDRTDTPSAVMPAEGKSDLKLRFPRSSPGMERLAEEYARIVQLMDGIQQHMAAQDARSERMVRSLDSLVESLAEAPQASRQQLELLHTISEAATADAAGRKRVEEELAQLPRIADAQRETMVSIGRQLDAARETHERVGTTMEGIHETITGLGDVTKASTAALDSLKAEATAREERFASMFQEQGRRLVLVAWSAIGLAAVVAVVFLVDLLRG